MHIAGLQLQGYKCPFKHASHYCVVHTEDGSIPKQSLVSGGPFYDDGHGREWLIYYAATGRPLSLTANLQSAPILINWE